MRARDVYLCDYELTELDTASKENKYRLTTPNADVKINEATKRLLQYLKKNQGRSSSQVVTEYTENHTPSVESVRDLLATLYDKKVLVEKPQNKDLDQKWKRERTSFRGEMRNLWFRKKLIDTDKYSWLLKKLGFTFSKPSVIISLLVFLAFDGYFLYSVFFSGWGEGLQYYSYFDYLFFLPLSWFWVFVHELGHTVATKVHDLPMPKGIGVGLYYFMIVFYADTHESWNLPRKERAVVSTAGAYWNLLALVFLIPVCFVTRSAALKDFILLCHISLLSVFNPFLKMDGYWLLTDLLGVVNLHKKIRSYFKKRLWGKVSTTGETNPFKGYPKKIKFAVLGYGVGYFLFLGGFLGFFLYRAGLIAAGFETQIMDELFAIFQSSGAGFATKVQTINGLIRSLAILTGAVMLFVTGVYRVLVPLESRSEPD